MDTAEKYFADFLQSKNLKFTRERRAIFQEVFATHEHFDVETLHDRLKEKGERISLATVYRLIPLLQESHMVQLAVRRDGAVTYEHIFGHKHHDHLVCVKCGRVIEFEDEVIRQQLLQLCRDKGFAPIDHRVSVRGVCQACRKKRTIND